VTPGRQLYDAPGSTPHSVRRVTLSGVAGTILTVWGRVWPPEQTFVQNIFFLVGCVSVASILGTGVKNSASQERMVQTIKNIAFAIEVLAARALAG
jgi:hypothetical protein